MYLTNTERDLMEGFWDAGKPMSLPQLAALPGRSWNVRSAFAMVQHLVKKGVLREAGAARCANGLARAFEPTMTREEYLAASITTENWDYSLPRLVEALLKNFPYTDADLDVMRQTVTNAQKQLQEEASANA